MNYIDILIAVLLLIGIIRGFLKGFIFELAVLAVLFLGMYAAFRFSGYIQPWVSRTLDASAASVTYLSSFILFLLIAVGVFFLAKLFEGLVNIAALGIFNKIGRAHV